MSSGQPQIRLLNQDLLREIRKIPSAEEVKRKCAQEARASVEIRALQDMKLDEEMPSEIREEKITTFSEYTPTWVKNPVFKQHTDPVVESACLASITPPKPSYCLKLPLKTIAQGRLSNLQLESIIYACSQHERFLPNGHRAGFFMADGPGVGKGRQIAGILLENAIRGRKKALWISVSPDLIQDARRDLKDIGASRIQILDLREYRAESNLRRHSELKGRSPTVLFLTYSLLVSEKSGRSRLDQIVEWCGQDFEGVVALDECHKAKNLGAAGTSAGGSKAATLVQNLQARLPGARVVYVSATGASEPQHLAYAARLGLWGPHTDFPTWDLFLREINGGGMGVMELLAMQMKASGQYLARSLSFHSAEFELSFHGAEFEV